MNHVTKAIQQASTIKQAFDAVFELETDMRGHMPVLSSLARDCEQVVEFGVRWGVSTIALLNGLFDRKGHAVLRSIDLEPLESQKHIEEVLIGERGFTMGKIFWFEQAHSLDYTIDPECDMLLIDSYHSGGMLLSELDRHAMHVRKWILLHDTETFGITGEDHGPGLLLGLGCFLVKNFRDWRIRAHFTNSNGLTLLERRQEGETIADFGRKSVEDLN